MQIGHNTPLSKALLKLKPSDKRHYLMWRYGLANKLTDYSAISKEEFINKYLKGNEKRFRFLKGWERKDVCKKIVDLVKMEQMEDDFDEVYKAVRKKALKGDDKAVKTFLMLQKEEKKRIKQSKAMQVKVEEEKEDEDNLILK